MKRSTFCHLGFAFAAAVAAAFSAIADGEVYYYWKGANDGYVDVAENWLDAEGNPVATAPTNGSKSKAVLVFTNFTGTVKCDSAYKYYGYILCDGCGNVTIGGSKEIHLLGGPIRNETTNKKLTFGYTTKLAALTNVIDVVNQNASIYVKNGFGQDNVNNNRVLVKQGKGVLYTPESYGSAVNNIKEVVMQTGSWEVASREVKTFLSDCTITFDGDDSSALVSRVTNDTIDTVTNLAFTGGCIRETESVNNTGHGFTDNGNGWTLSLTDNIEDSYFSGKIYDTMSFLWGPKAANSSRTFTFAKATHPTTGDFTVTNGIVRLVNGASFPHLGTVTVKSGATLSVESGIQQAMVGGSLVVESGATLYVAEGTTMYFDAITVAGANLDADVYSSSSGWISGGGKVLGGSWPEDKTATWNRDDYSPSIGTGERKWYVGANLSGDTFALTAGEGASAVIGSLGVTTANDGATYTWGWPTWLYGDKTWKIDEDDTLVISAPISAMSPGNLVIINGSHGAGKVTISADQPLSSRIVFSGPEMTLDGVTISSPVSIYSQSTIWGNGKTNTFAGEVSALNTTTKDKLTFKDGIFRFKGGVSSSSVAFGGKSEVIVEDVPWVMGTKDKDGATVVGAARLYTYCDMTLSVPSNTISINNFSIAPNGGNVTIRTTVPYAIYRGVTEQQRISLGVTLGSPNKWDQGHSKDVKWDLCGCDQEIMSFCASSNNAVITSESPAQLHYLLDNNTQNAAYHLVWYATTNYVHFTGAAGLTYEGTCNNTLALVEDSPTSGRLEVVKGKVAIAKRAPHPASGIYWHGGSWTNASAVAVSGTGRLTFEHSRAIGKTTDVFIDGENAKLVLDAGVVQRCRELYIDGSKQDHGTWGGPESGAEHKSNRLAGSGVLRVYGENGPGITIIFR